MAMSASSIGACCPAPRHQRAAWTDLASWVTHNWVSNGLIHKAFADFYAALKPGGILAIEDHRAPAGADPAKGDGYLPEAYVIQQAEKPASSWPAGSEINANPKDTKDYPFGVWTLPPTRRSSPFGQPENPGFLPCEV